VNSRGKPTSSHRVSRLVAVAVLVRPAFLYTFLDYGGDDGSGGGSGDNSFHEIVIKVVFE
jgi:hypothetical protein